MNNTYNEAISGAQNTPDYQDNHPDYGWRKDPEYSRGQTQNKIYDQIENTDWDRESNYHNSYRVNGKFSKGRTIKMSNKEWHRLNKKDDKTNI